ncbi:MAG TPA: polymer-forming cytoskeletal protein [Candidatus Limnocylindria bacterium]|nr:polymer-forming cytoskeletal protein [Candidatus Limnocylindria bacterium]
MFESNKAQQAADPATATAFLGKGAKLVGKISLDGPARIEGHVEGEIDAKDTLTIGEDAVVKAKITGTTVIVHGQVTGDIVAKSRLELRNPGRVHGNITTATLVIQEGTTFEGHCSMGEDSRAKLKVAPAAIGDGRLAEPVSSTAR